MKKIIFFLAIFLFPLCARAAPVNSFTSVATMQGIGAASFQYSPVVVTGTRGGTFAWVTGSLPCNSMSGGGDGGTTFCAKNTNGTYVTTGYWKRQYNGPVQVQWFEDSVGTDDTAAIQAAIDTENDVYIPTGSYVIKSKITISTPYQRVFGNGYGVSLLTCNLTVSSACIAIEPAASVPAEHVQIDHLHVNSTANVTYILEVGGPQANISYNHFTANSVNTSVIYVDDEDTGSGVFVFGSIIAFNELDGSWGLVGSDGGDVIRLGNNANTTWIVNNPGIINGGILVHVNGAVENLSVRNNNFAFCDDTKEAFLFDSGATPLIFGVDISVNYFEQIHRVFVVKNSQIGNMRIDTNIASRNTMSSKSTSAFFLTDSLSSALTRSIEVTNNNVNDYNTVFSLNDEPSSAALISTKGNSIIGSTTNWSVGTYAVYAFQTRVTNTGFINPITLSGSIDGNAVDKLQITTADILVPIYLNSGEAADSVRVLFTPGTSGSVTFNVIARDTTVTSGGTTNVGTLTTSSSGIAVVPMAGVLGLPHTQYYLEENVSGMTDSNLYPPTLYLRQ